MPGPTAGFTMPQHGSASNNIAPTAAPFFKSVHGTLNHLLATDRIWMQRFTGTGSAPDRLDTILFETLGELRTAREAEDRRIVDYVDSLDDARIAGSIR